MTPREIFRLAVAIGGLYLVYLGVEDLLTAVLGSLHLYESPVSMEGMDRYCAVRGGIHLVIGSLAMAGFFPLENLAYPQRLDESEIEARGADVRDEDQRDDR